MTIFEQTFDKMAELVRERFEQAGFFDHVVFLFSLEDAEPNLKEVPFNEIAAMMPGGVEMQKTMAYKAIASIMVKQQLPGYIEVTEGWLASMESGRKEDVIKRYSELKRRYGSIRNMPGSVEMLMVSGCYGSECKSIIWKIGRRGKEFWLESGREGAEPWAHSGSKAGVLAKTSQDLVGE